MTSPPSSKRPSILSALAAKFARSKAAARVYVCGGPDCCSPARAEEAIREFRAAIAREGLAEGPGRAECVKTGCLGVCGAGPLAAVHPGGTWYGELDREKIVRIAREHLKEGRPAEDLAFTPPPEALPPET